MIAVALSVPIVVEPVIVMNTFVKTMFVITVEAAVASTYFLFAVIVVVN